VTNPTPPLALTNEIFIVRTIGRKLVREGRIAFAIFANYIGWAVFLVSASDWTGRELMYYLFFFGYFSTTVVGIFFSCNGKFGHGLVLPSPNRPRQDKGCGQSHEEHQAPQQAANFGKTQANTWLRLLLNDRRLPCLPGPPFFGPFDDFGSLSPDRNTWASKANVIYRCHSSKPRASYWSSPTYPLASSKALSMVNLIPFPTKLRIPQNKF
jgi:hypothetical protein